MREPLTPEALRALTGVSELPAPLDKAALNAAMHRHYPPSLRERDIAGFVRRADVIRRVLRNGGVTDLEPTQTGTAAL